MLAIVAVVPSVVIAVDTPEIIVDTIETAFNAINAVVKVYIVAIIGFILFCTKPKTPLKTSPNAPNACGNISLIAATISGANVLNKLTTPFKTILIRGARFLPNVTTLSTKS